MSLLSLSSAVLKLDARAKLLGVLLALGFTLAGPVPWAPLAGAAGAFALGLACDIPLRRLLRPLFLALGAGAAAGLLRLWTGGGGATGFALHLSLRMAAGMELFTVFSAVTPPRALVRALRQLGVPAPLVDVLALAARYVSVLAASAKSTREAQAMRHGYTGFRRGMASFGALGGLTLLRAFDQASATAEAMAARGCRGGLVPEAAEGGTP